MIRKCLNTIKYGTAKARAIVLLSLLFAIGAVGAVVCAIVFRQILFVFAMIVCVFIVITLAQTLMIQGGVADHAENVEKRDTTRSGRMRSQDTDKRVDHMKPPVFAKRKKRQDEKAADAGYTDTNEQVKDEIVTPEDGSKLQEAPDAEEKNGHHKRKKQQKREVDDDGQIAQDNPEQTEEQPAAAITQETVMTYDRKKVRKTLHKFKVRRDHRMIFVDHSEKLKVNQTPAYIWVEKKDFHLLLIEQEPRHITIPVYQIKEITYLKKQPANEDIDYAAYRSSSVIADLFRPYLPDYSHSTVVDDLSAYKNLYGIGNDIYVTNRSASALFDLLGVPFQVDDRVTMSNKVNIYFKEAYKSNILLRDNVIDANGYADRISKTLDNLAHSTVSYAEFKDTLNLMIRNKMITQEFASYYMGVRDELSQ
ncbi:MAG: hypothetical protein J6C99_08160 [Lachnospiraceae bacterium]|nr:hypothetical protein [Lachnospiraceae bacterium]